MPVIVIHASPRHHYMNATISYFCHHVYALGVKGRLSSWAAKAAAAWTVGSWVLVFTKPEMQVAVKPRRVATLQFGAEVPWPHPPEPLVCATDGPAHLPVEKPQQPCWHSLSAAHVSVTTFLLCWLAARDATDWPAAAGAAALSVDGAAGVKVRPSRLAVNAAAVWIAGSERSPFTAPETQSLRPRAFATLQLGEALPKPQPPSRVWAMAGPAHLPVLKAQQPCWQSESVLQGPVTNWLPRRAWAKREGSSWACTPMATNKRVTKVAENFMVVD